MSLNKINPKIFRHIFNLYGPFLGAGIRVDRISSDWREFDMSMKLRWYNRNYVGVHFGGSLYAMVDAPYMLIASKLLGDDYVIWDKAAEIEFIKPGKGRVRAHFTITDQQLEEARKHMANGDKYLPIYSVDILDEDNDVVARAHKTLYMRKKREQ